MSTVTIESNPKVMMGKPVIGGTRITVALILDKLGAGESVEQILFGPPAADARGDSRCARFRRRSIPYGRDPSDATQPDGVMRRRRGGWRGLLARLRDLTRATARRGRSDERLQWDTEPRVQFPNHRQREGALPREHL